MGKAKVLFILALMLFLVGIFILIQNLVLDNERINLLAGIGPVLMGLALMILSRVIAKKEG